MYEVQERVNKRIMEESEKTSLFSIVTNIALFLIKYFLGIFSGSLALIADSIYSVSDIVGSIAIFAGLKISKRKSKIFRMDSIKLKI